MRNVATEYITRDEVAKIFRVSKQTVRSWELRGMLPRIKFNRRVVRYRCADVERMASRLTIGGSAFVN
jgi:DNA-binding transcriptional MerR regulator